MKCFLLKQGEESELLWFLLILMAKKGLKVAYTAHMVARVMRCLGHKVVLLGRINQLLQNFSCQFKAGSPIFKKIQAYDALPVLVCHTRSLPGLPRCCGNAPPHLHSVRHSLLLQVSAELCFF